MLNKMKKLSYAMLFFNQSPGKAGISNSNCVSSNSPQSFLGSKKFPVLNKCASSNRAVNFLGNFLEISGSYLKSE